MIEDIGSAKELQRQMNPKTQKTLIDNGADMNMPHEIINVFYVFRSEDIIPLVNKLEEQGFRIPAMAEHLFEEEQEYWLLEAITRLVPELSDLNLMTDQCVEIGARFNADYDGWYTEVLPTIH